MRKKLVWVVLLVVSLLGLSGCGGYVDIGPINVIGCSCGGVYDLCYPGVAQYNYNTEGVCQSCVCTGGSISADCAASGGIVCSSGQCILPGSNYNDVDCTVTTTQNINSQTTATKLYYLKSLTIEPGATLSFYNTFTTSGGAGAGSTGKGGPDRGKGGGDAGAGGLQGKMGVSGGGTTGVCDRCDSYCQDTLGGTGGNAGANIELRVREKIQNNGVISIAGTSGTNGYNGQSCLSGDNYGRGGAGGAGGGGAGTIVLNTNILEGTGKFLATGGAGGNGGNGAPDEWDSSPSSSSITLNNIGNLGDPCCGCDGDHGGAGGEGGGGAGGIIRIKALTINSHFNPTYVDTTYVTSTPSYFVKGGLGGISSGYCGWNDDAAAGGNGPDGRVEVEAYVSAKEHIDITTNQPIPGACNNARDDDVDGLIDMADPDCYNVVGDLTYMGSCISDNYGPSGGGYGFVKTSGSISTGVAYPSSKTGFDGCCGDDSLSDYGFISDINGKTQYLCYDQKIPFSTSNTKKFNWLSASKSSNIFQSISINNTVFIFENSLSDYLKYGAAASGNGNINIGKTDVISNSQDWYFCNANDKIVGNLYGKEILEKETFADRFDDGENSCATLLSTAFALQGYLFDESCYYLDGSEAIGQADYGPPYVNNCCLKNNDGSILTANTIESCINSCYIIGEDNNVLLPDTNSPGTTNPPSGNEDGAINKDLCANNPEAQGCLPPVGGSSLETCSGQPTSFTNELCDLTENYCSNGRILASSDSTATSKCCFGEDAKCIAKDSIVTESDCELVGNVYAPRAGFTCSGQDQTLISGASCCFGTVYIDLELVASASVSKDSFLCFKEGDNNIISQCCYDSTCSNADYVQSSDVRNFGKRISTKGSALHTVENYDRINKDSSLGSQLIEDLAFRYVVNKNNVQSVGRINNIKNAYDINGFSYLEFDVLTDSETITLSVNNIVLGKMFDYSTNGNKSRVWHHISVPLTDFRLTSQKSINTISFADTSNNLEHYVIIDNIILVPVTTDDLELNTENYYCTGGFEGWIDDLDPPSETTLFDKYGPYMFACSGIASYSWTGTQCCGDDTKIDNYGEYYSDSTSGCFDGSKIPQDTTISKIKNIYESSNLQKDRLSQFTNSDILYYSGEFIGCQIPQGKYDSLKESYTTSGPETDAELLLTDFVSDQCAVVGTHYCMNGVWRKKITTSDGEDKEFPSSQILIKTAPEGSELIKNGFR